MQLDEMVRKIGAADSEMIDMILDAAMNRKRELYPEWEMVYLALPKNDPQEREADAGVGLEGSGGGA